MRNEQLSVEVGVIAWMWEEGYLQGGRDERCSIKWDNTLRNDEGW